MELITYNQRDVPISVHTERNLFADFSHLQLCQGSYPLENIINSLKSESQVIHTVDSVNRSDEIHDSESLNTRVENHYSGNVSRSSETRRCGKRRTDKISARRRSSIKKLDEHAIDVDLDFDSDSSGDRISHMTERRDSCNLRKLSISDEFFVEKTLLGFRVPDGRQLKRTPPNSLLQVGDLESVSEDDSLESSLDSDESVECINQVSPLSKIKLVTSTPKRRFGRSLFISPPSPAFRTSPPLQRKSTAFSILSPVPPTPPATTTPDAKPSEVFRFDVKSGVCETTSPGGFVAVSDEEPEPNSENGEDFPKDDFGAGNPDWELLQKTTDRLKLCPRRASIMAWKARYGNGIPAMKSVHNDITDSTRLIKDSSGELTNERRDKINNDIQWIFNELKEMKAQDKSLAAQFLKIRDDIQKLRLQRSCQKHEELLEVVIYEMEERDELNEICDAVPDLEGVNPLKQIGVTRMNIANRRFSMC